MHYNVKMQVIPSIDVEKIDDLKSQLERLSPFYDRFQIDFADGQFVNFTTPSVSDLLKALIPYASKQLDLHLMTAAYQRALDLINQSSKEVNFEIIFIHHAAKPSPELFLDKNTTQKFGIVLNPEDDVNTIERSYDLSRMKYIQIMSINPGPQGSPFLPNTLNKIEQLRLAGYKNRIFLDGGVNGESLKIILARRQLPDFVCPGSFFSRATNVEERVQYLSEVLKHESNSSQNS